MGRPKFIIEKEKIKSLIDIQLPIPCIAKLLGVSERTVFRRMREFELSVSDSYSTMSDQELDMLVTDIKSQMPHVGYRLMMGRLRSLGHKIQQTESIYAQSGCSWGFCPHDRARLYSEEEILCPGPSQSFACRYQPQTDKVGF